MLITELVLHNFGVYKGRHVVDLAPPDESRPVVLIGGLNGAGKTTFLDALQLALYGHRARTSNRGSLGYEEYLRRCISRSAVAETGAALEITFTVDREGESCTYRVRRQWAAHAKRIKERLDVWVQDKIEPVLAENWADHVEEILPLEIASLFFFDGEKIEALADPERTTTVIKSAVQSLLGVGVIDRLSNDLLALQRRQKPAQADVELEARIASLAEKYREGELLLHEVQERLDSVSQDLAFARIDLGKRESRLAANGGDLLEQRVELEAAHARTTAELQRVKDELRLFAAGACPLAMVGGLLEDVQAQGLVESSQRTADEVLGILAERDVHLVAGLEATLSAEQLRSVKRLMVEDLASRRSVAVGGDPYLNLDAAGLLGVQGALAGLPGERAMLEGLRALLEAAKSEVIQAERMLAAIPASDAVAGLLTARDDARATSLALEGRREAVLEEKQRANRLLSETQEAWDRAISLQVEAALKSEDVARLVSHAERARTTLASYRSTLLARHIGKLEVAILESLHELLRKEALVRDLRVDLETFELRLLGADDVEIRPERLSAGERQMLAVAILWGLARVAGHRLPTIVDTPLGRLDGIHRRRLVERYFPHASRQVLLLSTDEEIDEELQGLLMQSVGQSYLIRHDEASDSSLFAPGYFWEMKQRVA